MRKIDFESFRTANPHSLRSTNSAIVLNFIRYHQPLSRADIASRTGLRRSTVSLIVEDLISCGLVLEERAKSLRRGGVPMLLSINLKKGYTVGIDIEVSETTVALADLMGSIIDQAVFPTPTAPSEVTATLARAVNQIVTPVPRRSLLSVGIAVSGLVDHDAGTVLFAPNLGWTNFPVGPRLQRRLGLRVFVDNESNLSALAEIWHGAFADNSCPDLVFVNVKEGIGTGIVIGGQVHRGFNSVAAEFGHMVILPDGPSCRCGNRGCWETLADDCATISRYLNTSRDPRFNPQCKSSTVAIDDIVQLALDGQNPAREALAHTAKYLALGIRNIVVALSPEFVVVAGAITRAWSMIAPDIDAQIHHGLLSMPFERVRLVRTSLKEKPSLVGAISFGLTESFGLPSHE